MLVLIRVHSICIILLLWHKYSASLQPRHNWCQPPLPIARRPSRANDCAPVPAPSVALLFRRVLTSVCPTPMPIPKYIINWILHCPKMLPFGYLFPSNHFSASSMIAFCCISFRLSVLAIKNLGATSCYGPTCAGPSAMPRYCCLIVISRVSGLGSPLARPGEKNVGRKWWEYISLRWKHRTVQGI